MSVKADESCDGDDIVVSGISGSFPSSDDIEEFKKNLFDGKDMVSTVSRWYGCEAIQRLGAMKNIDLFDNDFFHMSRQQAEGMTNSKMLLFEKIFEAIIDAGYNLKQIKRKKIAVVCAKSVGALNEKVPPENEESAEIQKQSRFEPANLISYWFDLNGPSITLDTGCSGSLYAIDHAIRAIQNGDCDGALVSASHICAAPAEDYFTGGLLSLTGVCRPFDADGDGFTRGEATVAIFLQKRKDARRIYANVIYSKTNCDGFKEKGVMYPSIPQQKELFTSFYTEININPLLISYIETHGTGTKAGDAVEGTALEEFFCVNRDTPLEIGSVKSNMGHSEEVAGLCSLLKMIISFEDGMLPANLHFKNPNPKIKGLHNGKLKVVTELIPIEGEYFGINSFGAGGSNAHILISPHNKIKKSDHTLMNDDLPRLVTVSGRTDEAVKCILNEVMKNYTNSEYIRLIHEIFSENIDGYFHRGYVILNQSGNHITSEKFLANETKRPVWFVFSGMGSQWPAMGTSLMKIPIFADSVCKSHKVLDSKGVNLMKILTSNDPLNIRNALNSYVGIVAIQIALVDVLKVLEIEPDGMIGHSIGEIACAYADECLTAEQTILIAYYYGLIALEAEFIHSTTIIVDQGYRVMKTLVPPNIDIISHDGPNCCTVSGSTEIMREFMEELNMKNISIREVHSSNIAYHSRSTNSATSKLISYLKKIISEPKLRSKTWLCTSAPEQHWSADELKYCSAQYFANNFNSPVYFEESCRHIPSNAIGIEIGPHGYLNDILKCMLPCFEASIAINTKNRENGIEFFMSALGKLYKTGCAMKLSNLYPLVEFPVSKSTPMISPSIKWKHDLQWKVAENNSYFSTSIHDICINPKFSTFEYITGHVIDERNLYPGLGYLDLIWKKVAKMMHQAVTTLPIVFENIRFERATNVPKNGTINFCITIHLGTNMFEITEHNALVVSGNVRIPTDIKKEVFEVNPFEDEISNSEILPLNTKDFYKELRLRGYHYKGMFKNVVYANAEGTYGRVSWENNFTTFMDTIAQVTALNADCRDLLVPTYIRKLVIDVDKHNKMVETLDKEKHELQVNFYPTLDLLSSGGVQIIGVGTNEIARRPDKADPVLEVQKFIPYISEEEMDIPSVIRLCIHIALENNIPMLKVRTYELLNQEYTEEAASISISIAKCLADLPLIQASVNVLTECPNSDKSDLPTGINLSDEELPSDNSSLLIAVSDIQNKTEMYGKVFQALEKDGFIITKKSQGDEKSLKDLGFEVCFRRVINSDEEILLLKKITDAKLHTKVIRITNDSYSWIPEVQTALTSIKPENDEELVIFSEKEPMSGILGFFNCLKNEENGKNIRCFFIADDTAPDFSLDSLFYKSQSDKNLSQNVFKKGQWGSYRHLLLDTVEEIETTSSFCMLEKRANFSSLKWVEDSLESTSDDKNLNEKSLIQVYYSSLNFKDVMLAVGRISLSSAKHLYSRLTECYLGFEYSGRDENGRRVMGLVHNKGIATMVQADSKAIWDVPDHLSLEEAASIPAVYMTVIHALLFRIELKKGASILIHAGSGGIGQAAINICLHYDCNIFTTVGTPEKVEFIKKTYPQIPESHICNSRDTSFEKVIMEQTDGRGVDIVLNSLAEEKLQASLRCVAKGGDFLEIGKFDMARHNNIEIAHFLKNITFHSVQLDTSKWGFTGQFDNIRNTVQEMLNKRIIKPIQRTVFQTSEVESAFRYMAAGKHIGKVTIKIRDEEDHSQTKPVRLLKKAKPRFLCKWNESYLIVGGLGGFGVELADWLILRGARNIVLSSRTGVKNGYQSYRIKLWRSYGVNVVISTDDVTNEAGAKQLLMTTNSLGPVAGIFNVALVLKDDPFSKQTEENFSAVAAPKAIATAHLDKLSREICPHLKHFVVFSSVACGRGNFNQTNYGFSNSVMERICESRKDDNLPALAIQWGAIGEVGVVADFAENNLSIVIGGTLQQNVRSCLDSLNSFMTQSNPIVASMVVAEKRHADSDIVNNIANILGVKDLKTISLTWTFPELGMDSIVAVEIKQILEAEFNMFFTPEDLRTMTFAKLYKLKEDKKNSSKSGGQLNPQIQKLSMDIKLIKEPFLRIPLNDTEFKKNENFEDNIPFVFPGIEGLASFMEPLAKNLTFQAMCFQYHQDTLPVNSLQKMGEYFVKFILDKIGPDQEFFIVGYSLGALWALEVTCMLEKKGRKGHLYLIDGSPLYHSTKVVRYFNKYKCLNNEEALQNYICNQALKSVLPDMASEENFSYIEKADGWESKKKLMVSILSRMSTNDDLVNNLLDNAFKFVKASRSYVYNYEMLETPCTLIRCIETEHNLEESYGLNEYFKNPVQVHKVDANHITILEQPETADIISNCPLWKTT